MDAEKQIAFRQHLRLCIGELKEIWKPIGIILSISTGLCSVKAFYVGTGAFFLAGVSLLTVAIAVLFTVPITSLRLLARRLIAFVFDLMLFGSITIGLLSPLYDLSLMRPNAATSLGIVWLWFFAFTVLSWRFSGTPGMKIAGLSIRAASGTKTIFLQFLGRGLLTLIVPVLIAGRILSSAAFSTRFSQYVQMSLAVFILVFVPLSVGFSGGQSLPDLLFGLRVLPKRGKALRYPVFLNRKRVLLLFAASLAGGLAYGLISKAELKAYRPMGGQGQTPVAQWLVSTAADQRDAARIRPYVEQGLVIGPDDFVQNVTVLSAYGKLPEPFPRQAPVECQMGPTAQKGYRLIVVTVEPGVPALVEAKLFSNLLYIESKGSNRPGFLVLELVRRYDYGVFGTNAEDYYTFCLAGTDTSPEDYSPMVSRSIFSYGSISQLGLLLSGEVEGYATLYRLPIF
ncbi:MAG TPA: RDD family protein [Verrucomicrobiae bacterium]|nr:RDD family protein [Verrucomicrobiae bacterium]